MRVTSVPWFVVYSLFCCHRSLTARPHWSGCCSASLQPTRYAKSRPSQSASEAPQCCFFFFFFLRLRRILVIPCYTVLDGGREKPDASRRVGFGATSVSEVWTGCHLPLLLWLRGTDASLCRCLDCSRTHGLECARLMEGHIFLSYPRKTHKHWRTRSCQSSRWAPSATSGCSLQPPRQDLLLSTWKCQNINTRSFSRTLSFVNTEGKITNQHGRLPTFSGSDLKNRTFLSVVLRPINISGARQPNTQHTLIVLSRCAPAPHNQMYRPCFLRHLGRCTACRMSGPNLVNV